MRKNLITSNNAPMQKALLALVSTVALSGCVSHLVDRFDPAQIKERNTPYSAYSGPERPRHEVVAVRNWFETTEKGNINATVAHGRVLTINGHDVSRSKSIYTHVLPGRHVITVRCTPGPVARNQGYREKSEQLMVEFKLGQTYYPEGHLQRGGPGGGSCEPGVRYVVGDEKSVPAQF